MKLKVAITKELFDEQGLLTFYDSKTVFFDPTIYLPDTVKFQIWGAGVMPGLDWSKYLDLNEHTRLKSIVDRTRGHEITIKGFGEFSLYQVLAGKLTIYPYDTSATKFNLIKDSKGNYLTFEREWNLDKISKDCHEYCFDVTLAFPYGAADLKLYAKGDATFEFNTDDCEHFHDYITNPNKRETFWGYLDDKELTTGSFKNFNFEKIHSNL